jgi:hypothetical protein
MFGGIKVSTMNVEKGGYLYIVQTFCAPEKKPIQIVSNEERVFMQAL